ncbi:hypothetical protein BGX21_002158 [Mortierella sp. AD011]|nr:hypothetical protein BGX21_002158 [Mortierella sp. AD011]
MSHAVTQLQCDVDRLYKHFNITAPNKTDQSFKRKWTSDISIVEPKLEAESGPWFVPGTQLPGPEELENED